MSLEIFTLSSHSNVFVKSSRFRIKKRAGFIRDKQQLVKHEAQGLRFYFY